MFKFNFDDEQDNGGGSDIHRPSDVHETYEPCVEIPLVELLESLPPLLSYSPLNISLPAGRSDIILSRRDLFDARFQLISQAADEKKIEGLDFLEAPSDLISGVYEGGLKTWECSLDLVDVLDDVCNKYGTWLTGRRILELGCGTAVPTLYLLHRLFSSGHQELAQQTHFHLQDFNRSVLELVTMPNIILAWCKSAANFQPMGSLITGKDMSPASQPYRDAIHQEPSESDPHHHLPPADPASPSELPINPSLIAAFLETLVSFNLHFHFSYGPWQTFSPGLHFDIILTSETIYRKESLPSLLDVVWKAYGVSSRSDRSLDELAATQLSLREPLLPACYVAGKTLYFGVGGGISDFVDAVENPQASTNCSRERGQVETIREHIQGVGRKVLRVSWSLN